MVHNGIEYAMMQSYAEGWELLEKVDLVDNVTEVFDSWRSGTVIRSWLLDLLVAAVEEDPHLDKIAGYAEDSGEGRWTVEAAIEQRRADERHRRLALRPLHLAPGRQPGDEGDRRDAQPVRRPRRPHRAAGRRRRRPRRDPARPVYVAHLSLHDFRSYATADVELEPGVTAFIGRNGQGKTNLVEAIDYLSRLASHRVVGRRAAGAGRAPTRPSSAPRSCATAAPRCSRSRSTRAGPTGPGSTGRRSPAPASWSAWCAPSSSRPRT